MKLLFFCIICLPLVLLLTGCPEEVGYELDTPLYVQNALEDSLYLTIWGRNHVASGDSFITADDVDNIYQFLENPSLIIALDTSEKREFTKISKEGVSESPIVEHFFLIHRDTLLQYSPETWDRTSGVKHYYLFSLNDFEQIDYTLTYP